MIYKTVSSKQLIAKVIRDFGIKDNDWVADAIEWIGEGAAAIGVFAGMKKKSTGNEGTDTAITVANHRAELPCDLESLIAVEYLGQRLPYGADHTVYGLVCDDRTTDMYPASGLNTGELLPGLQESLTSVQVYNLDSNTNKIAGEYYVINPNYIITSFESGHIKLHYNAFPVDDEGFPEVPDDYAYHTALSWYILKMILARGFEHPVFRYQDAETRWFDYRQLAANNAKYPSIDKMERFKNQWMRLIPNPMAWHDFYMSTEQQENIHNR